MWIVTQTLFTREVAYNGEISWTITFSKEEIMECLPVVTDLRRIGSGFSLWLGYEMRNSRYKVGNGCMRNVGFRLIGRVCGSVVSFFLPIMCYHNDTAMYVHTYITTSPFRG